MIVCIVYKINYCKNNQIRRYIKITTKSHSCSCSCSWSFVRIGSIASISIHGYGRMAFYRRINKKEEYNLKRVDSVLLLLEVMTMVQIQMRSFFSLIPSPFLPSFSGL